MANYQTLKSAIQQVVKTNGNNEITGALLQQSLLTMINSLGSGYQFMGIATPSTSPGTPDQNVFYIASVGGTYTNFDSAVVVDGIAVLKYNGSWSVAQLIVGNPQETVYKSNGIRIVWLNSNQYPQIESGNVIAESQNIILYGSWRVSANKDVSGRVGYTAPSEQYHYSTYIYKFTDRNKEILVKQIPQVTTEYRTVAIFDDKDNLMVEFCTPPRMANAMLLNCPPNYTAIITASNAYSRRNCCIENPQMSTISPFAMGKFGSTLLYRKSFDASLFIRAIAGYISRGGNINTWSASIYTMLFNVTSLAGRFINITKLNAVASGNISFAFYSSATTFDSTTYINDVGEYLRDGGGSIIVKIPEDAKSFAFYGIKTDTYSDEMMREYVVIVPNPNESAHYDLYDLFGVGALGQRVTALENAVRTNKIVCWGDSLTAGAGGGGTTYPGVLQTLIGNNFNVINGGIGGETSLTIAGRQGGRVFVLANDIVLPATTDTVEVQLQNYFGQPVRPLRQGGTDHINPCFVDGVQCVLSVQQTSSTSEDYKLFLRRATAASTSRNIKAGTPLVTNYMKLYQNALALVIWVGTNGTSEYSGTGDTYKNTFTDQIDEMVDYANTKRFIVIGMHHVTNSGANALSNLLELETLYGKKYGAKFINWRKYVTTNALADAGITPTAADTEAIAAGKCPPSLLTDGVHLTATGYTLLANLVYQRMLELGYIA